ncbi:MAG: hypothetical protein MUO82_07785 [Candidatus Thermoplasmatota archaeon]|nr:hypothetical protein [Candidatus Thermoplasmatota archaeon]
MKNIVIWFIREGNVTSEQFARIGNIVHGNMEKLGYKEYKEIGNTISMSIGIFTKNGDQVKNEIENAWKLPILNLYTNYYIQTVKDDNEAKQLLNRLQDDKKLTPILLGLKLIK